MYICGDCGKLFEEPKEWSQNHGEPHLTERWSGCPHCGGGFEEATECEKCGEYFEADSLYCGYCGDCFNELKNSVITYDNAFKYLVEKDLLIEFIYQYYYEIDCATAPVSDELLQDTKETFKRKVLNDNITGKKTFLLAITEYIDSDIEDFIEYLKKSEVI